MCGLVGGIFAHGSSADPQRFVVDGCARLRHRGPDDQGQWIDRDSGIALGHTRLSIVDLSSAGHQPMQSPDGRFVLVFNGEIYNHQAIRGILEAAGQAPTWRGHSDTETLLAAFGAWGVHSTLVKAVGMFSFALWDRETSTLSLARDRTGEKPMYYGRVRGDFVFASEMKALRAHPGWTRNVDRSALDLFLRFNYVPAPFSIQQGISKLPAGMILTVCPDQSVPRLEAYWSALEVTDDGRESREGAWSDRDACDELERLMRQSVKGQMLADVPLGAFLSGGVDSSAVVALMQAESDRPVSTFTIGFDEAHYNEAEHAKAVARHLGTRHEELYVTSQDALNVIPRLPTLYDEPFADSSQIPTFLVSQLARRYMTVALSGDGGDELFGGYNRYFIGDAVWRKISRIPSAGRRIGAGLLGLVPATAVDAGFNAFRSIVPGNWRFSNPGEKVEKLARIFSADSADEIYRQLVFLWKASEGVVVGGSGAGTLIDAPDALPNLRDPIERMMLFDLLTYLPDDILVKVDRAAMGASLETRAPFLDHRVIEFAWKLPISMKIRGGQGKWLLRQVLYKYVPKNLIERPKMGFGIPLDTWLRGPLRDWAESLIGEKRLQSEGYLNAALVRKRWDEHLAGRHNWQHHLWGVLMFQSWLETPQ